MPKGEINLGGFDNNALYDCRGANYLERKLLETSKVVPNIKRMDKWPNLDGSFLICEQSTPIADCDSDQWRIVPKCTFEIQVKTLNKPYVNTNKKGKHSDYKYSCDTKAMNYVLREITCNPVLLLFVDVEHERIFWRHLSKKYCESLNIGAKKDKTIFFNNTDEVTDVSAWIDYLAMLRDNLVREKPTVSISPDVQDAADFVNNSFDNELEFIKKAQYPNVWKFGVNYVEKGQYGSYAALYKINRGESKHIVSACEGEADSSYISQMYFSGYTLHDMLRHEIKERIDLFFDKDSPLPIHIMPAKALLEIFFDEVDREFARKTLQCLDTYQSGERIKVGWDKSDMTAQEYDEICQEGLVNEKAKVCADELLHRGLNSFTRPFEDNPYCIVNKDMSGFAGERDAELDKRNTRKFFEGIMDFYRESVKLLRAYSGSRLSLRGHHQYWVLSDFSLAYYQTIDEDDFQFEWKEVTANELPDNRNRLGWSVLRPINCSWVLLWKTMLKLMALRSICDEVDAHDLYLNMR